MIPSHLSELQMSTQINPTICPTFLFYFTTFALAYITSNRSC